VIGYWALAALLQATSPAATGMDGDVRRGPVPTAVLSLYYRANYIHNAVEDAECETVHPVRTQDLHRRFYAAYASLTNRYGVGAVRYGIATDLSSDRYSGSVEEVAEARINDAVREIAELEAIGFPTSAGVDAGCRNGDFLVGYANVMDQL
jgi:hypothetical protein